MQVELLRSATMNGFLSAAPSAGSDTDVSFRDTLDGARDTATRSGGDDGSAVRAREDGEPRDEASIDEATPERDDTFVDDPVAEVSTPTDGSSVDVLPLPVDPTVAPLPGPGGEVQAPVGNTVETPVVVEGSVAGESLATVAQEAATAKKSVPAQEIEAHGNPASSTKADVPAAVPTDQQAGGVVAQAPVTRVTPVEAGGSPAGGTVLQAEGSGVEAGTYFNEQGGGTAGEDTGRSHEFFLLKSADESEGTLAKAGGEPSISPDRAETLAVAPPESSSNPVANAEVPSAQAPTPSGGEGTVVVDGVSSATRAVSDAAARTMTVLRADPGEDAALMRRMNRLIRRAVRRGESSVRVRLDPPHLGRIDVEVRLNGDQVEVAFQVDDENVRSAILKHLEELGQALQDYGYQTDEVSVDLRQPRDDSPEDSLGSGETDRGVEDDEDSQLLREAQLEHLGAVMDLRG